MPIPRVRMAMEQVNYVMVARAVEEHVQKVEPSSLASTPASTASISRPSGQVRPEPTIFRIRDDDQEEGRPDLWSLGVTSAQSTGVPAVAATLPPPPDHSEGSSRSHEGGISQTTEHLLIAAGSIGATILIVMIVLAGYNMHKRGLTILDLIRNGKQRFDRRGPPPPPKYQDGVDAKQSLSNFGTVRTNGVTPLQPAMARSGLSSSPMRQRALERSDSFNSQSQGKPPSDTHGATFRLQSPPPPRRNDSHRREVSLTPSSAVLGQQNLRRSASTRDTRSIDADASEVVSTVASQQRAQSPLPPPPTFKQFLNNRPSISGKAGFGGMMSRFSWTNSNAPQTPHDPSRDTYRPGRESYMTSRSSVPRFRTVDSWVNQQSNRIEAHKLKEQFRLTSTTIHSGDEEMQSVPEVPAMPKNVERLRESSAPISASLPLRAPPTPPLPLPPGLLKSDVKHQRHDTIDTAPIFKHHPGSEVRFSSRSTVPSEILDRGYVPNVLS